MERLAVASAIRREVIGACLPGEDARPTERFVAARAVADRSPGTRALVRARGGGALSALAGVRHIDARRRGIAVIRVRDPIASANRIVGVVARVWAREASP